MITVHQGDLIANVTSGVIVHGCNAKGVMGAGIAKAIKATYPEAYRDYKAVCDGESYSWPNILGDIVSTKITDSLFVISAITQQDFGREQKRYVDYDAVESCFKKIYRTILSISDYRMDVLSKTQHIVTATEVLPEVHFPMIGAGLGGGDWNTIAEIIDRELPDPISKNLWVLK